MSHAYTPVATWNTDYEIPDDGDFLDATSVDVALEALGNRTQALAAATYAASASAADQDWLPVPLTAAVVEGTGHWEFSVLPRTGTGPVGGWSQTDVSNPWAIVIPLDNLPKAGRLVSLVAKVAGAAGHTTLPTATHLPEMQLWSQDSGDATGAAVRVQSQTDPSASIAAYEVSHEIAMVGITEVWENLGQPRYYVVFYGEDGADAITGLVLVGITAVLEAL